MALLTRWESVIKKKKKKDLEHDAHVLIESRVAKDEQRRGRQAQQRHL